MTSHHPRKKWGQNFLSDPNIARKIVAATEPDSAGSFVEIGPGTGALTGILAEYKQPYLGIEIDPELAGRLSRQFRDKPEMHFITGDFLRLSLPAIMGELAPPRVVIGNIPYNITSPILFKLFDEADFWDRAVLMMQKEVGERLVAPPGGKEYGLLSINAGLFAEVKSLFKVPSHLFYPKPRVDSIVVRLIFRKGVKERFADFQLFRKVIRRCFQQRRKMLRNSLSGLFSPDLISKLDADLTQRPEQLSILAWEELTTQIVRLLQKEGLK